MTTKARPAPTAPAWPPPPGPLAPPAERMLWCASVARWAPSKHNSQPWRFVIDGAVLEIWHDPRRTLGGSDPHRREMLISCGVAIHLAEVALRSLGLEPLTRVLPHALAGPIASISIGGSHEVSEEDLLLLQAISERRTDRGPLDAEVLSPALPFLLQRAVLSHGVMLRLVSTQGERTALADLVARADRELARAGLVDAELSPWLRDPAAPAVDGVPVDHTRSSAASYRAEFVQRDFSGPGQHSAQPESGPDRPLVGVLATVGDSPPDWVAAGRALGGLLLSAQRHGASASYLNQPIEAGHLRPVLAELLDVALHPQMVLRIGRGVAPLAPTPRRELSSLSFRAGAPW